MKPYFVLLCLIITSFAAVSVAQDKEVTDKAVVAEIINKIELKRKSINVFISDFSQRKEIQPFEEKRHSIGRFAYQSPDKVIWDFFTPEKNKVVMKDSRVYIVTETLKQVQILFIEENSQFDFLLAGLGTPLENLFKRFNVKCFENSSDQTYRFDLTPATEEFVAIIESFEITIDKKRLVPVSTKLTEVSGDVTTMDFSETQINIEIDPKLFEYKIPPDYEIIDYRE